MVTQTQLDHWTTREQLSLACAVLSSGDQNWVAVSRAIKLLSTEGPRPQDWFSTKNCALQYAKLLEGITPAKRKRDKSSSVSDGNETPGETLARILTKKRIEELTRLLQEEKKEYESLRDEVHHLEAGHLDHQLDTIWDQMIQEEKDEALQQETYNAWLKEREEAVAALHLSLKNMKGSLGERKGARLSTSTIESIPTTPSTPEATDDGLNNNNNVLHTPSTPSLLLSTLLNKPSGRSSSPQTPVKTTSSATPYNTTTNNGDQTNELKNSLINGAQSSPGALSANSSGAIPNNDTMDKPDEPKAKVEDDGDMNGVEESKPALTVTGIVSSAPIKIEDSVKSEQVDTSVIQEETMIIQNAADVDCNDSVAPSSLAGSSKEGYEPMHASPPSLPKTEIKSVWEDDDDLKGMDEVLQLGEVQRKYGRVAKYDYSKDRKDCIKLEKDSDLEEEEEEDDGFAGFGPSSLSIGSKKIGTIMSYGGETSVESTSSTRESLLNKKEPMTDEDEDVYNIDNDDTIGLKATKKQKLMQQHTSKFNLKCEDSNDSSKGSSEIKSAVLPDEETPTERNKRERRSTTKKLRTDDKSIDFDDCDSVDSLATNRSNDSCYSRKRKLQQNEAASPATFASSPHHLSDASPDSPSSAQFIEDPETEKLFRSWRKSVMILYNEIAAHKYASVFLKPITEERVPGYHAVVRRPMDLMSVKRNIEGGLLRSTEEFQRDIMLMCMNAIMFNTKGHIQDMANTLLVDALAKIEEFQSAAGVVAPESPHKTLRRETRESLAKRSDDGVSRSSKKRAAVP